MFSFTVSRLIGALGLAGLVAAAVSASAPAGADSGYGYEVWGADQSNSVAGVASAGTDGSYLWIWDSVDIEAQLAGGPTAQPLGCGRNNNGNAPSNVGPCDLHDVFPGSLTEVGPGGAPTGSELDDLNGFGRLHGMLPDPSGDYVTANIFAPDGGYVGVIDTSTKEAIALFRVTGTNVGGGSEVRSRSVHMSFFSTDGSQIHVANLNGKLLERIDVERNPSGKIKRLTLDKGASLGVGKGMQITAEATAFAGKNQHGRKLIGEVTGSYSEAALADLTPNGVCKENGCDSGDDGAAGGRPNNVIICPIPSTSGLSYVTMGGGGLLVADTTTTPISIVGEYGNQTINGAGCGGGQTENLMWLNAGVSASGAGATWSTFTMYTLDDDAFGVVQPENTPAPVVVYEDVENTATGGNLDGPAANGTGQLPGTTTRRDAHGLAITADGQFVHNVDRIRNVVEVFKPTVDGGERVGTYDLTSEDGAGNGIGPCAAASVTDDPDLPGNDPAPDLLEPTPDGRYLIVALRGPAPVSVNHSAQGSCPGVGVIELTKGGASGKLVGVLRSTNTVADNAMSAPGGHAYTGAERSDIHGAAVIARN
jgi:hypothetical protein